MGADHRDATWLDAAVDRHLEDSARMADALIELDRHPGHRLLTTTTSTGRTGRCSAVAGPALDRL